ncbi:MAG: flagellar M-ring protein FliF [Betaproteobacteria bacterium]|nr:flagellar M-ring protein FliF [Betaproteobacteria bacterium]
MAGTAVRTMQQLSGPGGRQVVALMLAAATAVALAVGAWMWSQAPDYRVLFSNVSDRDGGAIIASLTQMNVPYKFADGGGAILVPATHVHEARLRLASQGLPKGSLVGFELMETPKLGTSQFLEQVNYQRALEGELARSIQSVSAVGGARVHLAIPKPSVFMREQQKSSASVLVNLNAGRTLDPGQVSAIVHLVASSVPDLLVKNVTVVDQNGNLLSAQNDSQLQTGLDPGQLKYVKTMEQDYAQRIESIVLPVVGNDNMHAQVTADIDFSQTEQAEEVYRPNQGAAPAAIRSQTSSESSSGAGGAQSGGVPGALSNQPPSPASAPINGQPAATGATTPSAPPASSSTNKNSAVNYEVDKSLKHIRHSIGNIKRLSVAVVVNYRKVTAKDGRVSYKPRSEDDMAQINKLVREAMGYTEARGDTVTVANTAFTVAEAEALETVPFWKQPGTWALAQEIGKNLLIAGLVLFLFFKVLRPMFRSAMTPSPVETQALPAGAPGAAPGVMGGASYQSNLDSAKQLARQEPKLVANIVRTWVAGDER